MAVAALAIVFRLGAAGRWVRAIGAGALGVGLLAVLALPTASALGNVRGRTAPGAAAWPAGRAGEATVRPIGGFVADQRLIAFLMANARNERYLLATPTAVAAAPIIIQTGRAVMAMGGFTGADPILTPASLPRMVDDGQVRFVMLAGAGGSFRRALAAGARQGQIAHWVVEHGKLVPPALWRSPQAPTATDAAPQRPAGGFLSRAGDIRLYDLTPAAGLIAAR